MLRLAKSSTSYDVTVNLAGEPTKMVFRSLTLVERLELIEDIVQIPLTTEGIAKLAKDLGRVVVSIDGYQESPAEVFVRLEHHKDLDDLCTQIVKWCRLPEQEAKNLDSSPGLSDPTPESAGSVPKSVGSEDGPALTNESDSKPTAPLS